MIRRPLGRTGLTVSALGLGCSRIASLGTRRSPAEMRALLERALDHGITLFDTADIYGQGDSERLIGRVLSGRRDAAVICTKAGLTLRTSQTLIRLAKPALRPVLTRVGRLGRAASAVRQGSEDTAFEPQRLRKRLEGSLRRLKTDHVDVFLLHSPPLTALADGALYDLLDSVVENGLARTTGVSCRSLKDAGQVIAAGRVDVVQVPLSAAALARADELLAEAAAHGVGVIAREVFAGGVLVGSAASPPDPAAFDQALKAVVADPRMAAALVGVTTPGHLAANVAAVASLAEAGTTAPSRQHPAVPA
ncbi:MAG: aldo/keto reductase [Rhodospirillales bacterium]|nr:MAG: aldo/keto reductase [Rhodospirillales bacterium]